MEFIHHRKLVQERCKEGDRGIPCYLSWLTDATQKDHVIEENFTFNFKTLKIILRIFVFKANSLLGIGILLGTQKHGAFCISSAFTTINIKHL